MLRRLVFCLLLVVACVASASASDTLKPHDARYAIHPGDVITVDYRYTPEYNATVSIEPDGFASLPFLGEVKLGGLTLLEAHDLLVLKASVRLNDPEVIVGLKEFEKPNYTVGGEVRTPGRYEIHGRITALRAIEIAGGFKNSGKSSQVLLIRPISPTEAKTVVLDLKKVLDKRQLGEDIELQSGDMLIVPKTRFAKVEPYLRLANVGFYLNPLGSF